MKRKYRLSGGSHNENGVTYLNGDVVESDRELDKEFVGKFTKIIKQQVEEEVEVEEAPVPVIVVTKKKKKKEEEEVDDTPKNKDPNNPWTDVTKNFPNALEGGLVVFQDEDKFAVFDKADLKIPLNDKGPLTETQLVKFIEAYLK